MHRKFFAIGLALSFALTGGFLGWQQLQLYMEEKAAEEPEEIVLEQAETAEDQELSEEGAYSAEEPIPEFPDTTESSDSVSNEDAVADSASQEGAVTDRLAAIAEASGQSDQEQTPEESDSENQDAEKGQEPEEDQEIQYSANVKKKAEFTTVDRSYFSDALMVGDSRMVGIKEYGGLSEPSYFAYTGLSTFSLYSKELEVKGIGTIGFEELITEHQFGKIYIMLGINEAGSKLSEYTEMLDTIVRDVKEKQPDAIIFLMANLHVTKYKSQTDKTFANSHIDEINASMEKIAAKYGAFYIDANPLFDDGEGNLSKDCASDYAHLKGWCYPDWIDFICSKGIVYEKEIRENLL